MFNTCALDYLVKKTIKVIRSCENVDHLMVATLFLKQAAKEYCKICPNKMMANQFTFDMVTLVEEILADFARAGKTSKPWNPFINPGHNPFAYPVPPAETRDVSQI
jgi:hypothetical protein